MKKIKCAHNGKKKQFCSGIKGLVNKGGVGVCM